jgi:Tfp pilus assembly protein PilO
MTESPVYRSYKLRKYYQNLKPLFKSPQFQGYAMVAMSLFTISFFGFFAIKPTLKTITVLNRQIMDKNTLNSQLDQKINNLILAQDEYKKIQNDLSFIFTLMPYDPQFPLLFRKLELLASQNGASISDIQFNPIILYQNDKPANTVKSLETTTPETNTQTPVPQKTIITPPKVTSSLSYTLAFAGEYQNLITLLDQLTKLDRLVTILSVHLVGGETANEKSKLNIVLKASSYYLPLNL